MYKCFAGLLISLILAVSASAQQRLSPPERPPVPLSDSDQLQAEVQARSKPASDSPVVQISPSPPVWSGGLSSGDRVIDALVREASVLYGVDPRLILLVMQAESGFRFQAVSPKGAIGPMQLMPSTAARLGVNILDARENIFGGVKYLRWLLDRFGGDVQLALAGYNAGEHAVESYGNHVPPFLETQNYVRSIVLRYSRFRHPERPGPLLAEPGTENTSKKFPDYNQIIQCTSTREPVGDTDRKQ